MSLIENQCDGVAGDGEEAQVLAVGGKLLPDLIEGADPGAGQVAHVGEVDGKRERAAGAGSKQPPGELNGGADIHRASYPDVGNRTVGSDVHGERWPGMRDAGTGAGACAHDGGPAEPVPQPHDGALGAGRGTSLRGMADLQFVDHLPGHHQPVAAAGSGRVRPAPAAVVGDLAFQVPVLAQGGPQFDQAALVRQVGSALPPKGFPCICFRLPSAGLICSAVTLSLKPLDAYRYTP